MGMKATVSEKGQVTIPKPLRDRMGLRAGVVLEFREEEGQLIGRKHIVQSPVDQAYGILTLDQTVDEFLREARGAQEIE